MWMATIQLKAIPDIGTMPEYTGCSRPLSMGILKRMFKAKMLYTGAWTQQI